MDNNYTIIHLHSDLSNGTTNIDSVTKCDMYIEKAKELNMNAIAFTEHGNIYEWVHKKQMCDKYDIKYIHGVEAYVTENKEVKERDNYHVCLYAKNFEGVKEINYLLSHKGAYNRKDGHFYYVPRITYEKLKNTSDNIIISTACMSGIIASGTPRIKEDFIMYLAENKHRCFLEIQHHDVEDQKKYNNILLELSKKFNIPLIAGTDTHSLNSLYADGRIILQRGKNINFDDEKGWDMTLKSYEELVEAYKKQNYLPMDIVLEAIDNTNVLSSYIEEFELDTSHKYPKILDNPEKDFIEKINSGVIKRRLKELPNYNIYKDRILYEFETYKKNDAIDLMLLEEDIISYSKSQGIYPGYSRGSVSGSLIAYVLGITEMDSIKHNLNFERFMNSERVSLPDIDTDIEPKRRDEVKKYLYNKKGLYCADIITFNTIADKGAIRDVARAFKMPLQEVNNICKNLDNNEEEYRKLYPELFKYVDLLKGAIVSVGSHPCGTVVSPYPIEEYLGTFISSTSDYPITQVDMKEIDSLNYVKIDLLGLDNIELINETCKLAGIKRITPDNIDVDDTKVWDSILKSSLGIFQWEGNYAYSYYRKLFSKDTIAKIKSKNPNIKYIDLFSMGNGALRPAGESYREALAKGEYKDNGHEVLNKFLSPTIGFLVFQEQIIEFLNKFCGFTLSKADIVRRGFAKKTGTEQYIPEIKDGFIKTMKEKYNIPKEEAEKIIVDFIKVIEDASSYLFSINHSMAYSYIGYACAWLRYYYPLEFLTVLLNINIGNQEKTAKIIDYAATRNIKVEPIKFRKSASEYKFDRERNIIYKSLSSIKFLNSNVADKLYKLRNKKYNDFVELLNDITNKTSCNSKQLDILIKLDFFSEFGKSKKLAETYRVYSMLYGRKQISKAKVEEYGLNVDIIKRYSTETDKTFVNIDYKRILYDIIDAIKDVDYTMKEKIEFQQEYLGYIDIKINDPKDRRKLYVIDINTKNSPKLKLHCIGTGKSGEVKVRKKIYKNCPIEKGDIIHAVKLKSKPRAIFLGNDENGKPMFKHSENEKDWWLEEYAKIKTL